DLRARSGDGDARGRAVAVTVLCGSGEQVRSARGPAGAGSGSAWENGCSSRCADAGARSILELCGPGPAWIDGSVEVQVGLRPTGWPSHGFVSAYIQK